MSVLKGSLPFMADLMRAISIPVRIDLMEVSSYGGTATESSGLVRILKDLSASIEGEEVLIVEDIIDTGLTLNYLLRYLRGKNPRSLRVCTLLDKPARRLVDIQVDYVGLHDPRPVRRRLRARLRRVLPQPAVRGRPPPRGLLGRRLRMHRRPLGRGRRLAAIAALIILVGCVLPWWQFGGGAGLPLRTGNAFEGAGILVFFSALATIALVTLPYATDGPSRSIGGSATWPSRSSAGSASCCAAYRPVLDRGAGLPNTAPGLWLSALGLIVLSRAVYEIAGERRDR